MAGEGELVTRGAKGRPFPFLGAGGEEFDLDVYLS